MIRTRVVAVTLAGALLAAGVVGGACKSGDAGAGEDAGGGADSPGGGACTTLFGSPNAHTGLGPEQCAPRCGWSADAFVPPTYGAAFEQALVDGWKLETPYPPLDSDPYAAPAPPDDPAGMVCAVLPGTAPAPAGSAPRPYTLVTYPSEGAAAAAGAHVTHFGHCGVCSTLANLAVYMRQGDLVAPVRACGLQAGGGGSAGDAGANAADVACLEKLGFDLPCAQAWAYNSAHTQSVCLTPCLSDIASPYNELDGALNACLQCDENESGPAFKAVAGRTRRNSGLPNAICRPCGEVQPLVHSY
jgi:hypothetical protein